MKVFKSLPEAGEGEVFYTRYASLIPSIRRTGFLSQVVSGLTEFGIVYAIALGNFIIMFPAAAVGLAIAVAFGAVGIIEGGLRKVLPFAVRACIRRRFKGWDLPITVFVLVVAIVLMGFSGLLSFQGSQDLVERFAPPPPIQLATIADSSRTASLDLISRRFAADTSAAGRSAAADLVPLRRDFRKWTARAEKTGRDYSSRIARSAGKIEVRESQLADQLGKLESEYFAAITETENVHTGKVADVDGENDVAADEAKDKIAGYGKGFAWFTVICLFLLLAAVVLEELHEVGAGVAEQVEPGAFDFEPGAVSAFLTAVGGRWSRFVYGLVHSIEKETKEAPKPVVAPALWEHGKEGLRVVESEELVERKKSKFAPAATDQKRRQIGFGKRDDAGNLSNALTHCVSDDKKEAPPAAPAAKPKGLKVGNCVQCGTEFVKNTTWQKYCDKDCRSDANAEKHGGTKFDPQFKYRKDEK